MGEFLFFFFFPHTEILKFTRELREDVHLGYLYQAVVCHPTGAGGGRHRLCTARGSSQETLKPPWPMLQRSGVAQGRLPAHADLVLKSSEMCSASQSLLSLPPLPFSALKNLINIAYLSV